MVESLPRCELSGRSVELSRSGLPSAVSHSKYKELCESLRRGPCAVPGSRGDAGEASQVQERARHDLREMCPSEAGEGGLASLAPGEPPGIGRGAGELAELLALFNPAGGSEAPPAPGQPVSPGSASAAGTAQVAELVERWVRRVALGGDQRRGVARLDIGQGRFAGAELLVTAEGGSVFVELTLPAMVSDASLGRRLRSRLEQRGFSAEVVVR